MHGSGSISLYRAGRRRLVRLVLQRDKGIEVESASDSIFPVCK